MFVHWMRRTDQPGGRRTRRCCWRQQRQRRRTRKEALRGRPRTRQELWAQGAWRQKMKSWICFFVFFICQSGPLSSVLCKNSHPPPPSYIILCIFWWMSPFSRKELLANISVDNSVNLRDASFKSRVSISHHFFVSRNPKQSEIKNCFAKFRMFRETEKLRNFVSFRQK
jgi:hypothetical protein